MNEINNILIQIFNISSIIIIIITLFLKLIYLTYMIFFSITNSIFISIIIQISLGLISLHYIINEILFFYQLPIFGKIGIYSMAFEESKDLISYFNDFNDSINLLSENYVNKEIDISLIEDTYEIINEYINIFFLMEKHFKLSKVQKNFNEVIKIWKEKYTIYEFSSLKYSLENKNYIKNFDLEFKKQFKEIILITNKIINIIKEAYALDYNFYSFKRIYSFFYCDLFFSFNQRKSIFKEKYFSNPNQMITKDNQIIEYTIIESKIEKNNSDNIKNKQNKNLVFFCNPNGMYYEQFSDEILNYYFGHNNLEILFWNYRGYGLSSGYSNLKNIKNDCLDLFDLIIQKYNYKKILVHGYSIGGFCAIYISHKRYIDCLISDRNFSSVDNVVKGFNIKFNKFIYYLYKLCFFNHNDNLIYSFLNSKNEKCEKIILCDPNDNIINNFGSIKTGISEFLIQNNITGNNSKFILDFILKEDKEMFINSLIFLSDKKNFQKEKYLNQENYNNIHFQDKLNIFFNNFSFSSEKFDCLFKIKNYEMQKEFIHIFFNNFFIWGTKSENDFYFDIKNNSSVLESSIIILNEILKDNENNHLSDLIHIENVVKGLNKLKKSINMIKINKTLNKGNLIKLTCGHNGILNENEQLVFEFFLKKINFLDN